jgi:hypothetical protein
VNVYRLEYSMYGQATIKANSLEEAKQIGRDGLMDWSGDLDWEDNVVEGADWGVELA